MNWHEILLVLQSLLFLFLVFLELKIVLLSSKTEKNKKEVDLPLGNIDKIRILLEKGSIDNINLIIDTFIHNAANNYLALSVSYDATEGYINAENADEMSKYILGTVMNNMTPDVIGTIGIIYNLGENNTNLVEVLRFRIKLYMISQLIQTNSDIE